MIRKLLLTGCASVALLLTAQAGVVGQMLPDMELEGLTQSPADSLADFSGQLILLEFFAYW